jgi:hypothetical protein
MSAKSFIGEIETTARRFYAEVMRGEVNDTNVRGFLRAASQIEDLWNQADERITALIAQGTPVWRAYAQLRYTLAFLRAARGYQVFVQELLAADAASDPSTAGYLPRVPMIKPTRSVTRYTPHCKGLSRPSTNLNMFLIWLCPSH